MASPGGAALHKGLDSMAMNPMTKAKTEENICKVNMNADSGRCPRAYMLHVRRGDGWVGGEAQLIFPSTRTASRFPHFTPCIVCSMAFKLTHGMAALGRTR